VDKRHFTRRAFSRHPGLLKSNDWREFRAWNTLSSGVRFPSETAQLYGYAWVKEGVSSVALKSGFWMPTATSGARGNAEMAAGQVLYESLTDAEVMLLVGNDDNAAFDYLALKFHRPMIAFMYRMCRNQALAEELAQEVFLRVYRSRKSYAAEAKFTTWLYRIATNLAVNHARDNKVERSGKVVSLDEPDDETGTTLDVADPTLNAEQVILRRERLAAIKKHVMALPEKQRAAVLMHKYQSMDYREIAAVLKLSESATKSLLFRAYEALRERLKEFV
jgi:RNA polymerase sigma-70 factor (ECF subfamily)